MARLSCGIGGLFWLSMLAKAYATPSPLSLNTNLAILFNNDLLGASSSSTEAILLLDPMAYFSGQKTCAAVHESLLIINSAHTSFNLTSTLGHLVGNASLNPSQRYWVGSTDDQCVSTNNIGQVSVTSCEEVLPVLCTQTAPFSNITYADTSPIWQVRVQSGGQTITGFRDRASFRFLGVRFAEQPERFGYAKAFNKPGIQSALSYGQVCYQAGPYGPTGSEDCLFLNIFTPFLPAAPGAIRSPSLKPVMMYIHGGGFVLGTGADPDYDGGNMASRGDVVIVTINYRLGTLGYLALDDGSTNGNYGLSDQIIALDWLHSNIAAFGGDPNRITIFGQSAGAASVRTLLSSPPAIGKFAAAVPQGDVVGPGLGQNWTIFLSIEVEAAEVAKPILEATGCSNAASQVTCLRALNATILVSLNVSTTNFVVDGTYITRPNQAFNGSVEVANVHLLTGVLHDEMAALLPYLGIPSLEQSLLAFGFDPSVVLNSTLFPLPTGPNATLNVFNATVHIATDYSLRCLSQAIAYAGITFDQFKTAWFYEFERSYQVANFEVNSPICDAPITSTFPYGDTSLPYFRCHGGDVYYTFGNLARQGRHARDNIDIPFSQLIVDSWTSFARTYNPNPTPLFLSSRDYTGTLAQIAAPGGTWQPVTAGNPTMRSLDWPTKQEAFDEQAQCDLINLPVTYYF